MIDLQGFDDEAQRAVARAETVARELGLPRIGTEHLLVGLVETGGVATSTLLAAGATAAATRHKVRETAGAAPAPAGDADDHPLEATPRATRALGRAVRFSHQDRAEEVGAVHVLLGVLDVEGTAGQVLRGVGVDVGTLRATLLSSERAPDAQAPPALAPEEPAPARIPAAGAPICPSCGGTLGELTFRILRATDDGGRTGDAVVFCCPTCRAALGAAPARQLQTGPSERRADVT